MNTLKMISEIKSTCATLNTERADLASRIEEIDDLLTGYRMAIDALELTMNTRTQNVVKNPEPVAELPRIATVTPEIPKAITKPEKYGNATVLEHNGVSKTIKEWAKDIGMTPSGIVYRLNAGWKVEDALTHAAQPGVSTVPRKPKVIAARKVCKCNALGDPIRQYVNVAAAASDLRMSETTVQKIIEHVSKSDQLKAHDYYLTYA